MKIATVIENAAKIISPLWPMQTIIARNPLQCLESLPFEEAIAVGNRFLVEPNELLGDSRDSVNRQLVKWCQVFLDEGQASITMPERQKGFYRSWSRLAGFDKQLQPAKNRWLLSLPSQAEEAIVLCLKMLTIPEEKTEEYFTCCLGELPGWAGYCKWRSDWQNASDASKNPISLVDFMAVRLVITCAIGQKPTIGDSIGQHSGVKKLSPNFMAELKAKEQRYLQNLLQLILPEAAKSREQKPPASRPDAQIVFCIDVRSEPLRLRLEQEGNYETLGFAGFFGVPVSVSNYNTGVVSDCCPVLLKPRHIINEVPDTKAGGCCTRHKKGRSVLDALTGFYHGLKYNFATPFALVETLGVWCGLWMAIRTLFPVTSVKLRKAIKEKISPTVPTLLRIDIPLSDQVMYAETALRVMGLTKGFSQLVVFCGHRSTTENNPYASALDCGACGGNHGGSNSKILASILNSSEVRAALLDKGIVIPDDTLFIGAQHDTTKDEVGIDMRGIVSIAHSLLAKKLQADFDKAGLATSQYRCKTFGINTSLLASKKHVLKRSANWAEVRPEWGLARNAAFIVGPRTLTKPLNLEGRCFLHSYECKDDEDGKSLETILTAPMVVAEWINTQYFFSTLDNSSYGSGSKITHNVTGKIGVMQGNSSDLLQGLPVQSISIHDDSPYHESMRLQVVVNAPRSRIDKIIEKHSLLNNLLFNDWVILVSIDPIDNKPYRLTAKNNWVEIIVGDSLCSLEEKLSRLIDSGSKVAKVAHV